MSRKIEIDEVMKKTISGDRKISGKRISVFDYFRIQSQNPSAGFLFSVFFVIVFLLLIPVYPKVAAAIELNEQKKVAFEEKLMPRSLAIPVNMLPYIRFQHQALRNGKFASWHQPVFTTGSCDRENLHAMPDGIYKQAIQRGCFQLNEIQMQYSDLCKVDNCNIDPNILVKINYIMAQIEEPFWGRGFVEEVNPCSGSIQRNTDEPCAVKTKEESLDLL